MSTYDREYVVGRGHAQGHGGHDDVPQANEAAAVDDTYARVQVHDGRERARAFFFNLRDAAVASERSRAGVKGTLRNR
jgi:hypothetical protein